MAFQDFLLRARRPASLVAFNAALPSNFKLIEQVDGVWQERRGVGLRQIAGLSATIDNMSSGTHYNLRVIGGTEVAHHAWSGWDGIFITEGDPDWDDGTGTGDPRLDNTKLKRWFKNNGVQRLDPAVDHPRSGRTMRWFRWEDGTSTEWLDITIDAPVLRRRIWLGDTP